MMQLEQWLSNCGAGPAGGGVEPLQGATSDEKQMSDTELNEHGLPDLCFTD